MHTNGTGNGIDMMSAAFLPEDLPRDLAHSYHRVLYPIRVTD